MKRDWRALALIIVAALLVCAPMLVFHRIPGNDTAGFYSPMIREIGAGRWEYGFFSVTPPLFCVAGGLFAAVGIPAFMAAKLASTFFFALTVIPLFDLLHHTFNRKAALFGCALLVLCSQLLEYAGEGILATGKTFFLVLLVTAVCRFRRAPHWRYALLCGVAAAGLCLIRGEGIIFAGFGLLLMVLPLARRGQERSERLARLGRIGVAVVLCLVLISPWLVYEYRQTGWPVTDAKQVTLLKALFADKSDDTPNQGSQRRTAAPPAPMQAAGVQNRMINSALEELSQGLFFPFLLFAVPGIILRRRQKNWTRTDTLLAAWIVLHTLFFLAFGSLTGVIQKRYFTAAIPLYLGWAGVCLVSISEWARPKPSRRRTLYVLAAIAAAALIWKGTGDARPPRKESKRAEEQAILDTAAWLNTIGRDYVPADHPRLQSKPREYHNGRHPIVMAIFAPPVLLAHAEWVYFTDRALEFGWLFLRRRCEQKHVNFIVVDEVLASMCPVLMEDELPDDFIVLDDRWADAERPYRIVGFVPNLNLPGELEDGNNSSQK